MAEFDDLFNAAADLIGRNLSAGRGSKTAFIDSAGAHSYDDLERLSNQVANALTGELGLRMEERILLCLNDTIAFPACFLGAIKAGIVPIPVNTRLTAAEYDYMLDDSRVRALILSENLLPAFDGHLSEHALLDHVIVAGADGHGNRTLDDLLTGCPETFEPASTRKDDICFWLYTSGTTGRPKGAVHLHSHMIHTAELYAQPTLGLKEDDIVYSAAKLFFAYGLGNGLSFPMSVGATTILLEGPPTPDAVIETLQTHSPTIFYGVPTLYAMLLASGKLPEAGQHSLRLCTSAGEALPADLLNRFKERTGCDILDGIGTTEMLHIFISNRQDHIKPGATGLPVPGYEIKLVDDDGSIIEGADEMGYLEVNGPTSALFYWNQAERTRDVFRGNWSRTGDKYIRDADGFYTHAGRSDDMLKVGGIYVSPVEVEAALITHEAVLEAAVVGQEDADKLTKPKAFVVLNEGQAGSDALSEELIQFVRKTLAEYKRPRWVEFVPELPKTATGKIQRFKLRG